MNYKMIISYDGTAYHGWAIQPKFKTIQGVLNDVLICLFKISPVINASGRTDAGVHAINQVINVKHDLLNVQSHELMSAVNSRLPYDIHVKSCVQVDDKFHARYFAKNKTYMYILNTNKVYDAIFSSKFYQYNKPIDLNKIKSLIPILEGKHNFLSFSTTDYEIDKCVRVIKEINISVNDDYVIFKVTADGFLRSMVRMLIGTFLAYNENKISLNDVDQFLNNPRKGAVGFKAPACGLYLLEVNYED